MCRSARRGDVGASDVCGAGEQTGKIGVSCVWGACFVKTWRYRARGELGNTLRGSKFQGRRSVSRHLEPYFYVPCVVLCFEF